MRAVKFWAYALITDAVIASMFWLWQSKGMQGAGNVLCFWVWATITLRVIVGIGGNKETFAKNPRPDGFSIYHTFTELAVLTALAWFGYCWTAGIYTIALLIYEAARTAEPKVKKEAA